MAESLQNQTIPSSAQTAPLSPVASSGKAPEPVAAPAPERVSPKLQALAKREQQALAREQAAKAKESEVTAATQALAAREARVKEFETLKETNPLKALELLGLSYQELTQSALSDGQVPPEVLIKKVEDKLNGFVNEQEKHAQKAAEESKAEAQRQEAEVIADFQNQIGSFITENAKKYELIQFEGQQALVYSVIDEHYNRTMDPKTGMGKIMSIADAADKVEAFLDEKYNKAFALEKFKSRVVPSRPTASKSPPVPGPKQPTGITNSLTGQARPRPGIRNDEDRVRDAIAYWKQLRS